MRPDIETVKAWLGEIPDPEIPVISLVDLGIIRDVKWQGGKLVVTVTPTYSGCPATAVIRLDIATALNQLGIDDVEMKTQLSPAWTTDWISQDGLNKLREYGIAPPIGPAASCAGAIAAKEIACPHCGEKNAEKISDFGSTPCKAHYRCKSCLEPFDYFKAI